MTLTHQISRRLAIALVASAGLFSSVSVAAADKIKVAAIYTLPVEQQWISRIHKALNTAADRGDIEYTYSENVANTDYERVMREYAEQGQQLIVGEVFGLERAARKVAKDTGGEYISPYNDPEIVFGQGTIGAEIITQCDNLDAIIISVGGGGMISGVAGYLKSVWPNIEVIAASPENHAVMIKSLEEGKIVKINPVPTIVDGTAGGVEEGSVTFDYCQRYVDHSILLSEKEIEEGIIQMIEKERVLVEGAAGTSVAALIKMREQLKGKRVGIIVCGKNISLDVLKRIL